MSPPANLHVLSSDPSNTLQDVEVTLRLAENLEESSRYVARNLSDRYAILRSITASIQGNDVWSILHGYWRELVLYFDAKRDVEEHVLAITLALAKLERNLIAGLYDFQAAARPHEPFIRQLLFLLSSFTRIEEPRFFLLQSILTQLLSNLISPVSGKEEHQQVADHFLALYLSGDREADVIIRLLDSRDSRVNTATLHLISNLTRGSPARTEKLLEPSGIAWLSRIISHLDTFHTAEEQNLAASAAPDRRFELATALLTSYIPLNLHGRLFAHLASPDEPISPSQTTYLKIIDSYIHSSAGNDTESDEQLDVINNRFLLPTLHLLAAYSITSMQYSPDDARLPKVFEALHLVCEILCAIGLRAQARADRVDAARKLGEIPRHFRSDPREGQEGSDVEVVNEMRDAEKGVGVVKPIIDTLQQLEVFLPRSNPRTARSATEGSGTTSSTSALSPDQIRPIASLKRILVQLLGVLSFSHTGVGDQVRECGGVQLILGMTEVDENNPLVTGISAWTDVPDLREHALFTVRNLMQNNPQNQAVIAQMDPVGVLSETGEVLPVPERMKQRHEERRFNGNGS